jgi:hypothetical protein
MNLYCIGCSITHGYGVGIENSYPSLLKKYLQYDIINDSKCGVGNDWILHTALENISKLNNKPDLVIIQWSGANRRTHIDLNGNEWYVTLNDHTHLQPKFEPMGSIHTIHYMFCLQLFLEKNNIPYLFFNYMDLDQSVKNLKIYNKINWKNSIEINRNLMMSKKYVYDDIGHPNLYGQYYITKNILKKLNIDTSNILDIKKTIL